jgi:hypothetical protein
MDPMNETASNVGSSASTTNRNIHKEESMNSPDVSAVSAVAGSSASTNPATTGPNPQAKGTPASRLPPGNDGNPQDAGGATVNVPAPQTDPPPAAKKKRKQPEPFNPAAICKRAETVVASAKGLDSEVIIADVQGVEARSAAIILVGARVAAATLQVPTTEKAVAVHDAPLDVAVALVGTALRKHGPAGAKIYRQSLRGDLYDRATALLGRIRTTKTAVALGLMHGLESAIREAGPAVKVRNAAVQELEDAKGSYRTARQDLIQAIHLLEVSLFAHHAQAKRLQLAPIPAVKGSKRAA